MGARPVAIEDAKIVDFEGAFLVVEAPVVGRLLVPSEMIDDDSEVWRVGDAGTILVAGAWAKQRGIKGKRKPKVVSAPVAGAPVELVRKASVKVPSILVAGLVRVPDEVLVQDVARARNRRKPPKRAPSEHPPAHVGVGNYSWHQLVRMQRLWEEIQSGVIGERKKGNWERQQERILRTYCVGWTWEQVLERMQCGSLGQVPPDPDSKTTWKRAHTWEDILRRRKEREKREDSVAPPVEVSTVRQLGEEVPEGKVREGRLRDQFRRERRMQRLWEDIQSGSPDGDGLTEWERKQSQILRTRCAGWTWEQVLECMQKGPLELTEEQP